MRSHFSLFTALLSIACTVSCLAGFNPGQLRCEYLENPLGIDATQPRLSWIVESNERGQKQTAYQIIVAGSAADGRAQGDSDVERLPAVLRLGAVVAVV